MGNLFLNLELEDEREGGKEMGSTRRGLSVCLDRSASSEPAHL